MAGLYFAYGDSGCYSTDSWTSRKIVEAVSRNGLDWVYPGFVEPDTGVPAIHVPETFVRREITPGEVRKLRARCRRKGG